MKNMYFLQNVGAGFVGNSPYWWQKENSGYVPNIEDAKQFTNEEANDIIRSTKGSHNFKKWKVKDVMKSTILVVDIQKLRATK